MNTLNFSAGAAIGAKHLIMKGTSEGVVLPASAGAEILGVSTDVDAAASARVDVRLDGPVQVTLGGTVSFGDKLASDASACGVKAVAGNNYGAIALEAGAAGDVIDVLVVRGKIPVHLVVLPVDATKYTVAVTSGGTASNVSFVGASLQTVPVGDGSALKFTVTAAAGYAVSAVKANGTALTAVAGVYTVTVDTNTIIEVTAAAV